jgi:hypothetical protein
MRLIIKGHSRSGTTITRDIVSSLNKVMLTNEFRTYDRLFAYKSALSYFKTLSIKCKSGRTMRQLGKKSPEAFVEECLQALGNEHSQNKAAWVRAVETVLFAGRFRVIGDKTDLKYRVSDDLYSYPSKYIFIHRDGRDCVASGLRHFQQGMSRSSWAMGDVAKMSRLWAQSFDQIDKVTDRLSSDDYEVIRFDEYRTNPGGVSNRIGKLLDIKPPNIMRRIQSHFDSKRSHTGYFQAFIPDWEELFSEEAKDKLRMLGYI